MKRQVICVDMDHLAALLNLPPDSYIAGVTNQLNDQAQLHSIKFIVKNMGEATPVNQIPIAPLGALRQAGGLPWLGVGASLVVGDTYKTALHLQVRHWELSDRYLTTEETIELVLVETQLTAVLAELAAQDAALADDCTDLRTDLGDVDSLEFVDPDDAAMSDFRDYMAAAESGDPAVEYRNALTLVRTGWPSAAKSLYRGLVWRRYGHLAVAAAFWHKLVLLGISSPPSYAYGNASLWTSDAEFIGPLPVGSLGFVFLDGATGALAGASVQAATLVLTMNTTGTGAIQLAVRGCTAADEPLPGTWAAASAVPVTTAVTTSSDLFGLTTISLDITDVLAEVQSDIDGGGLLLRFGRADSSSALIADVRASLRIDYTTVNGDPGSVSW